MIRIICEKLYSYHVDSITIVKDKAVLVLNEDRGVKMIDLSEIVRIEEGKEAENVEVFKNEEGFFIHEENGFAPFHSVKTENELNEYCRINNYNILSIVD